MHLSVRERSALVLHGYVADARGFRGSQDGPRDCASLHEVVDGFDLDRDDELLDWLRTLRGSFALVRIDLENDTMLAVTDRLATRPIWWRHAPDGSVTVGSHALEVAEAAGVRDIDTGALASFLLFETQLDPETSMLAGVRSQPEASLTLVRRGAEPHVRRWFRAEHTPETGRSTGEWVTLTKQALTTAAARIGQVTHKPTLFMSGGLDSRIAAAALRAADVDVALLSLCDSPNTETRVASAAAKALGFPHTIRTRDSNYYLRAMERSVESANGSHLWIHSHFGEALEATREQTGAAVGILGDFCEAFSKLCFRMPSSGTLGDVDSFVEHLERLPLPNYAPKDAQRTIALLHEDVRQQAYDQLIERTRARAEKSLAFSPEPEACGDHFFRWQRVSCHATFQMFYDVRMAAGERNVMFDQDVHDLLLRMPAKVRDRARIGARVVGRLHKAVARVPDANSLLPPRMPRFLHTLSKRARPVLGKIKRRLLSDTYRTTASWPHIPLLMQRDPTWRQRIEELLFDECVRESGLFDERQLASCWTSFQEGDLTRYSDVEKLLSVATLLGRLRRARPVPHGGTPTGRNH